MIIQFPLMTTRVRPGERLLDARRRLDARTKRGRSTLPASFVAKLETLYRLQPHNLIVFDLLADRMIERHQEQAGSR